MAEEPGGSEDSRKLATITNFLEKTLECPVCLEVAKPPVQQCSKGHLTCSGCVDKMTNKMCPLCSQEFCVDTSTCFNNLLGALPHFCKYSESGCKEVCVPGDDEEHEDFCGFRSIACRLCKTKTFVNNMKKHYQDEHAAFSFITKRQEEMTWGRFDPCKKRTSNVPVSIDEHLFYIKTNNDTKEKNLKIWFDAFYIGKPKTNYYLSVKFEKGEFVQHNTIQAIVTRSENDSDGLDVISETDRNVKEVCMYVPQEFLSHFVTSDGKLKRAYSFFTM